MEYKHLTQEERYQIKAGLSINLSINEIARRLNRSPSTISREIRRNKRGGIYYPKKADELAKQRKANNAKKIDEHTLLWAIEKLKIHWRPEQISHKSDGKISHTSIYNYLHKNKKAGGDLYKYLVRQKKYRHRLTDKRGQIPNKKSIHERPLCVENRTRIGDWEIDTIIGKRHKQAIVTAVERRTGLLKMKKIETRSAEEVARATIEILQSLKMYVKTITADNGKEFAQHEKIKKELCAMVYFADPYSSWQRGTNENTNGLIRQYLPKQTDFSKVTEKEIQAIEEEINNRPRKRLKFKTPNEVFFNF